MTMLAASSICPERPSAISLQLADAGRQRRPWRHLQANGAPVIGAVTITDNRIDPLYSLQWCTDGRTSNLNREPETPQLATAIGLTS